MSYDLVPSEVTNKFAELQEQVRIWPEWKHFVRSLKRIRLALDKGIPFDPRFNAVHWILDVRGLCRELAFGYCMMDAWARYYKAEVRPNDDLAHVEFHVSYFADNNMLRLFAARDKLALAAWAYYSSFDPNDPRQVLDYGEILERFRCPEHYGLALNRPGRLLRALELLKAQEFKTIKQYRNLAVHRREPRIEIYGVAPHHDMSYMVPICNKRDIQRFEDELAREEPRPVFRDITRSQCTIKGRVYEQRRTVARLWPYAKVQKICQKGLKKLLEATGQSSDALLGRRPLNR